MWVNRGDCGQRVSLDQRIQVLFFSFRYMVDKENDGPLISMDVKDFILTVGARSPTPGGGCVAALTATLVSLLRRDDTNLLNNLPFIHHRCHISFKDSSR